PRLPERLVDEQARARKLCNGDGVRRKPLRCSPVTAADDSYPERACPWVGDCVTSAPPGGGLPGGALFVSGASTEGPSVSWVFSLARHKMMLLMLGGAIGTCAR